MIPADQYLSSYAFVADPNCANTHLVLIRKKMAGVFHDVTLDCAGAVTGWTNIGSTGTYQYARVDCKRPSDNGCRRSCESGGRSSGSPSRTHAFCFVNEPFTITQSGTSEPSRNNRRCS